MAIEEIDRTYMSLSFSNVSRSEADRILRAAMDEAPSLASFSVHYSEPIIAEEDDEDTTVVDILEEPGKTNIKRA